MQGQRRGARGAAQIVRGQNRNGVKSGLRDHPANHDEAAFVLWQTFADLHVAVEKLGVGNAAIGIQHSRQERDALTDAERLVRREDHQAEHTRDIVDGDGDGGSRAEHRVAHGEFKFIDSGQVENDVCHGLVRLGEFRGRISADRAPLVSQSCAGRFAVVTHRRRQVGDLVQGHPLTRAGIDDWWQVVRGREPGVADGSLQAHDHGLDAIFPGARSGVGKHRFAERIGANAARDEIGARHVEGYFHIGQRPLPSVREAGDNDFFRSDQRAIRGLPERKPGVSLDGLGVNAADVGVGFKVRPSVKAHAEGHARREPVSAGRHRHLRPSIATVADGLEQPGGHERSIELNCRGAVGADGEVQVIGKEVHVLVRPIIEEPRRREKVAAAELFRGRHEHHERITDGAIEDLAVGVLRHKDGFAGADLRRASVGALVELTAIEPRHDFAVHGDERAVSHGQDAKRIPAGPPGQRHGHELTAPQVYGRKLLDEVIAGRNPRRHIGTLMPAEDRHRLVGANRGAGEIPREAIQVHQPIRLTLVECDMERHSRDPRTGGERWSDGDQGVVLSCDDGKLGPTHGLCWIPGVGRVLVPEDDVLCAQQGCRQGKIAIRREIEVVQRLDTHFASGGDMDGVVLNRVRVGQGGIGPEIRDGHDRGDAGADFKIVGVPFPLAEERHQARGVGLRRNRETQT